MSRLLITLVASLSFLLGTLPAQAETTEGAPAPAFTITTDNGELSLESLKGRVVYLDFWASWCTPCRASFPWMNAMQERYGDYGLTIIGVNLDKDRDLVKRFTDETPATFTIGYDPEGEYAGAYDVQVMPSSYLIDKEGNLVKVHRGFRDKDRAALEQEIRQLLQ